MIRHVASVLVVGGLMASWASAQAPQVRQGGLPSQTLPPPVPTDPAHRDTQATARRTILRQNPSPRSTSYRANPPYQSGPSSTRGFSNPGGVGRYAEYYTANTPNSQVDLHPQPTGRFDFGGGPDRSQQIAAAQAGQQRARNIQDNINAYGRPYGAYGAGLGYGLGLSGGLLYNYPY